MIIWDLYLTVFGSLFLHCPSAGIFKQSMGARNKVVVQARQATYAGGIYSLEWILGLFKSLKIRALDATMFIVQA